MSRFGELSEERQKEIIKVQEYFYERFLQNQDHPHAFPDKRKQKLTEQIKKLGMGTWFGYEMERVDIVVPDEGLVLETDNPTSNNKVVRMHDEQIVASEDGTRQFIWTATLLTHMAGAKTVFLDAESDELGVYDRNWTSTFTFNEDQTGFLAFFEDRLSNLIPPHIQPIHIPENPGRFRQVPLAETQPQAG